MAKKKKKTAKKTVKKKSAKLMKSIAKPKYNSGLDMLCHVLLANAGPKLTNEEIGSKLGKAYPDNNAVKQGGFINLTRRRLNEGFFVRHGSQKKALVEYDAAGNAVAPKVKASKKSAKKKIGKKKTGKKKSAKRTLTKKSAKKKITKKTAKKKKKTSKKSRR